MSSELPITPAASAADDDDYILRMSSFLRLATDSRNSAGCGPCAATIQNYVLQGVLPAKRDSAGRLLFRRKDAKLALHIYLERRRRHGAVGRKGFQRIDARAVMRAIDGDDQG
jgi:hypothetical protein